MADWTPTLNGFGPATHAPISDLNLHPKVRQISDASSLSEKKHLSRELEGAGGMQSARRSQSACHATKEVACSMTGAVNPTTVIYSTSKKARYSFCSASSLSRSGFTMHSSQLRRGETAGGDHLHADRALMSRLTGSLSCLPASMNPAYRVRIFLAPWFAAMAR